jgi:hypothetical protein
MKLSDMRAAIRVDMVDGSATVWSDAEIDNCIESAVSDLTRILPLQKSVDYTLSFTVTDEAIATHVTVLTTPIQLASTQLRATTLRIYLGAAPHTEMKEGTDFTVDNVSGIVTPITGGAMVVNTAYTADYDKLRIGVDITGIASGLLRIEKVEYYAGFVPQKFNSFSRWGNFLTITSPTQGSQEWLIEGRHMVVSYYAEQTPPTASLDGSYPAFLDPVIIIGAEAYMLQMKMAKLQSNVELYSANAQDYLETGDDLIDTLNKGGQSVAPTYANYASVELGIAQVYSRSMELARAQAQDGMNSFWAILRDKLQLRVPVVTSPVNQGRA